MKKGAAQRACALLAALALCAALGTGVFAEAAPGPAASGVESAAQTQGQGQSGAGSEETADSALSHQPETPADESSLTEEGTQAAGDAEGQAGAEQDAGAQAALQRPRASPSRRTMACRLCRAWIMNWCRVLQQYWERGTPMPNLQQPWERLPTLLF